MAPCIDEPHGQPARLTRSLNREDQENLSREVDGIEQLPQLARKRFRRRATWSCPSDGLQLSTDSVKQATSDPSRGRHKTSTFDTSGSMSAADWLDIDSSSSCGSTPSGRACDSETADIFLDHSAMDDDKELVFFNSGSRGPMGDITNTLQDEIPHDDAKEVARIIEIEHLLDSMNFSSEDLNNFQKSLGIFEKARRRALRVWAVGSSRLIKAIGKDNIKRAAPHHRQRKFLESTRAQVASSSAAFLKASEGGCSEARIEKLARRHAKLVAEYQAAQQSALKLNKKGSVAPSWLLESTAPYFEAEAAHCRHLEKLRIAEAQCNRRIADAKQRYHRAMRGLEDLSEAEHHERSESSKNPYADTPHGAALQM